MNTKSSLKVVFFSILSFFIASCEDEQAAAQKAEADAKQAVTEAIALQEKNKKQKFANEIAEYYLLTKKSDNDTLAWLKDKADQGNPVLQLRLAHAYKNGMKKEYDDYKEVYTGFNLKANSTEYIKYLKMAATNKFRAPKKAAIDAMELGDYYYLHSKQTDLKEALKWYKKHPPSKRKVDEINLILSYKNNFGLSCWESGAAYKHLRGRLTLIDFDDGKESYMIYYSGSHFKFSRYYRIQHRIKTNTEYKFKGAGKTSSGETRIYRASLNGKYIKDSGSESIYNNCQKLSTIEFYRYFFDVRDRDLQ